MSIHTQGCVKCRMVICLLARIFADSFDEVGACWKKAAVAATRTPHPSCRPMTPTHRSVLPAARCVFFFVSFLFGCVSSDRCATQLQFGQNLAKSRQVDFSTFPATNQVKPREKSVASFMRSFSRPAPSFRKPQSSNIVSDA